MFSNNMMLAQLLQDMQVRKIAAAIADWLFSWGAGVVFSWLYCWRSREFDEFCSDEKSSHDFSVAAIGDWIATVALASASWK